MTDGDTTQVPFSIKEFADGLEDLTHRPSSPGYWYYPNFAITINDESIEFSCYCFRVWSMVRYFRHVQPERILYNMADSRFDGVEKELARFRIDRGTRTMEVAPIIQNRPDVVNDNFLEEIDFDRTDYLMMLNPDAFTDPMESAMNNAGSTNMTARKYFATFVEENRDNLIHVIDVRDDHVVKWEDFSIVKTMEALL